MNQSWLKWRGLPPEGGSHEVQTVIVVVLGTPLVASAFRRKIGDSARLIQLYG